jgi:hypothetical protein
LRNFDLFGPFADVCVFTQARSDSVIRRCRLQCPVCPKADTAGRLRPEGRTTTAIGPPRRVRRRTTRRAGARSTWCVERIPQDGAFACLACRARRDSSRADFCYLDRSPNNMPVRIVGYVLARSATWLARPKRFELLTPRFRIYEPQDAAESITYAMALAHCQRADTRSKGEGQVDRMPSCLRSMVERSWTDQLSRSAGTRRASSGVHSRILDICWTHPVIWDLTY